MSYWASSTKEPAKTMSLQCFKRKYTFSLACDGLSSLPSKQGQRCNLFNYHTNLSLEIINKDVGNKKLYRLYRTETFK